MVNWIESPLARLTVVKSHHYESKPAQTQCAAKRYNGVIHRGLSFL
jgi:hypothetical protein